MQELFNKALEVVRGVLRFRWLGLVLAFVVATSGWLFVYKMQDIYQANARVYVDTNRVLQPLLRGVAVQPDLKERVRLMSRTLLSRPNLETIARTSNPDFESFSDSEKEAALIGLRTNISLAGERGNLSLYSLAFSDPERALAKRTLEALIDVFIKTSASDERNDSESAQVFLTEQIKANEIRLAESERRLSDFKRENAGKMPGEAGGYYQRLESGRTRLRSAQLELLEAENRRDTLRGQITNERATVKTDDGVIPFSPLDETIQGQNSELASLLVRYTERHPKIAQLRESIAELEARKIQIQQQGEGSRTEPSLDFIASPVYQEMRRMLSESEARVSELKVRVSEYGKQVGELVETVESIPKVEAELVRLDRGYNVVKEQNFTLLKKLEAARLSEQLEQNVDDVTVRVIDPAFVSAKPVAPPKLLLIAGVFLAALGSGAAFAFLLSILKPVFYDAEFIKERPGSVFLGGVSEQSSKARSIMSLVSWVAFSIMFLLLCIACLILIAIHAGLIDKASLQTAFETLPPFLGKLI